MLSWEPCVTVSKSEATVASVSLPLVWCPQFWASPPPSGHCLARRPATSQEEACAHGEGADKP